ncbi:uncharacterized protein [Battus philenor]|uniref:uncharacterized protein n=1 Tax=Battus philenor TaxID=42288 RepID=UPI0035D1376A
MVSEFMIYARGRWREIETGSGVVSGMGRAQFVYVRDGKLVFAPRRGILRALRRLAADCVGAARDGPELSKHKLPTKAPVKRKSKANFELHPHHTHVLQACIQCTGNAQLVQRPRNRTHTVATQLTVTAEAGVQTADGGSDPEKSLEGLPYPAASIAQLAPTASTAPPVPTVRLVPLSSSNLIGQSARPAATNRHRPTYEVSKAKKPSLPLRNKKGLFVKTVSQCDENHDPEKETNKRKELDKPQPSDAGGSKKKRVHNSEDEARSAVAALVHDDVNSVKELVIPDDDVRVLRRFLSRTNRLRVDLRRFDTDDEYKERVFYELNPVVSVERSARVSQLLLARCLGLRRVGEVVRPPGYRTRGSLARSSGHRFRASDDKENDSEPRAARTPRSASKVLQEDNVTLNNVKPSNPPLSKSSSRPQRRETSDTGCDTGSDSSSATSSSSDSDTDRNTRKQEAKVKEVERAAPRVASTRGAAGGTGGSRNYSALEDHAIVSWLRVGRRACLVNGNRVWRELQQEHAARTGTERSWHSLRNRYLRHLLPALSHLVSPRDASRLRAAAAAGELKKRECENSLLAVPSVRSASSRRTALRAARSPSPSPPPPALSASTPKVPEAVPVKPTPTYSQITRRFGDASRSSDEFEPPRTRRSLRNVEGSATRPPDSAERVRPGLREAPAKRRLYNPNAAF